MVAGRPSLRYQALTAALTGLMVYILMVSLAGFWKLESASNTIRILALAGVLYAWVSWRVPWSGSILLVLGAAGLVGGVWYLPEWAAYAQTVILQAQDLWEQLRAFQFDATFGPALGAVFLTAVAVPACLLILRETLERGNTFWSIALGAYIFGSQWVWYYDKSVPYFMIYMALAFGLWVLGQAARRDARWESTGRRIGYRSHILTPVAGVLLVAVVSAALPNKFEPMDLGALGERAQEAFPILKKMRGAGVGGGGRFSLRSTGFAPSVGALGGPVRLDHSAALNVTTGSSITSTLYLRGITLPTYDGETWLPGDWKYETVAQNGQLPATFTSSVPLAYPTIKLSPAVSMGGTLFTLLEPMRVDGLKTTYKADPAGNLLAERVVSKGTAYEMTARVPQYSAEQIRNLTTDVAPGQEFAPYLEVPSTLPRRVSETARSITAGQAQPFDKAVALEAYFRGMQYDLNVPATPSGRDFVDYFLFDLQRGYCTYFASAMTVMLRELGIPSRFVEGFALPPGTQYTQGPDGKLTYTALNSMAHAWVEAYFPGYGWVTFDPTPRSDIPLIDRSRPAPVQAETPTTTPTPTDDPTTSDPADQPDRRGDLEIEDEDLGLGGTAVATVKSEWPWAVAGLAVLGALALLAIRKLKLQDRIAATEERQVVQEAWTKTTWLMQVFGFGRKPHQTAHEYADALGKTWPNLREAANQVADDYTSARYAPPTRPVDAEAPSRARKLWESVHQALFDRYGWRSYLWRRLKWRKPPAAE